SGCATTNPADVDEFGTILRYQEPSKRAQSYSHYLTAMLYERQGRYGDSLMELRKASDLEPEAVAPIVKLIQAYLRMQDDANARVMAERAVRAIPNSPGLWIVLGQIYHRLKRYDEAVESFEKAIELDPESGLGYGALIDVEQATNDLVAAVDIYQRLIKLRPDDAILHYQLALTLARISDNEGARKSLEKALELQPDLDRARFLLGIICLESGELEKAEQEFTQYLPSDPADLRAREHLAGVQTRLGKYTEAIGSLGEIFTRGGKEPRYIIELFYVLVRAGQYEAAAKLGTPPDTPIFGAVFQALVQKGLGQPYRFILESLDTVEADIDDECVAVLNELLFLFGKEETGSFLLDAMAQFHEDGVRSKVVEQLRARTLIPLERYEEAEQILLKALDEYGPDKYIHYYLATIYESMDRFEDVEKQLLAYLALEPGDPEVMNFLGYSYAVANVKLDKAEALLKQALEIDPHNGFYLDSLGWIYYRMGDAKRAIDLIRQSILAMETDDAEVRDHLGDAYLLGGDVEKALAEWERARRLDPTREGIQEKIDKHRQDTQ
ncbi:MAG: Tetratricopeptide repeat protein, partial [Candidatus Hydrogenedentes bacterium]|nr:Tetratricopeptide repeat protein [Candidatus Hydrogenedentota bacterium]